MNALIPLCFKLLSVVAKTTEPLASAEFVIHILVPFMEYFPSPFLTAVVAAAPASLPLPVRNMNIEHYDKWACFPS